jgi:hypothetical protein
MNAALSADEGRDVSPKEGDMDAGTLG